MRKFTKFFFALLVLCCMAGVQSVNAATKKVYATFENPTPAGNATWVGTTKTFTWSQGNSNAISNIGLPTGDITAYEKIVVDCDINSGEHYRILFYATGHGTTSIAIPVTQDGKVEFKIADYITNDDYLTQCSGICLSGGKTSSGEVKVNEVYLETYDDGVKQIHANYANINAPGNAKFETETNTLTWSSNGYNQVHNIGLPNGNITKYKKLVIDCDIISGEKFRILFYQGEASKTLWIEKTGTSVFYLKEITELTEDILLNCDKISLSGSSQTTSGKVVIKDLYLETYSNDESYYDISLTKDMYHKWDGVGTDAKPTGERIYPTYALRSEQFQATIYGDPNVDNKYYADLTGCDKLKIKGTPGAVLRLLWNRQGDNTNKEINPAIGGNGIVEIDLNELKKDAFFENQEYLHLNVIKLNWGVTATIESITILRNLVITDGEDFKAKFNDYSSATYTHTFNTEYDYGTICLPFAPDAATCANYTFYKLDQANANTLMFVEEAEPKANTAYLYCLKEGVDADDAKTLTGGYTKVSTEVAATTSGDWSFIGSLKNATIDLTADGSFYAYKPDANNGENKISKATKSMSVNPYRAYFHYTGKGKAVATMRVIVRGDGTTGIEEVITPDQIESVAPTTIYNLMGQPVAQPVKGQIYIVNGKKVVY